MQQKNIPIITRWKTAASTLKKETYALFLAAKHPDTPWYAKLSAGVIVAYAFSPIDLIPDFIPILGYLDDLILLPLGVLLARKMNPFRRPSTHQLDCWSTHHYAVDPAGHICPALWVSRIHSTKFVNGSEKRLNSILI